MKARTLARGTILAGCTAVLALAAPQEPAKKEERVRDRFWIWCHEAGSHNTGWGLSETSRMTPVEGAVYLDVPNLIMVRYEGRPAPPYDQVYVPFRPFRQVVWSIVGSGGATQEEERREVFKLAAREPNLTGVIMDDFFRTPKPGEPLGMIPLEQLKDLRGHLTAGGRRLDLWVVLYDHQLDLPVGPYLEQCDTITFWTWTADRLKDLEANFAKAERLAPGKRRVLGCYLYDYGRQRPMPVEAMKAQCETGLGWLKAGRIDGMIFLASCIADLNLDAVEWTRRWIADVGGQPLLPIPPPPATSGLFARDNLVAWCIVPFDAKKRGPETRAEMLRRLGFTRFAYDWRDEHLPAFEAELAALAKHGVRLEAVWFPARLDEHARFLLDILGRRGLKPQLWVMPEEPGGDASTPEAKAAQAAERLRPVVEAAARIGCPVALYNHGGWFGEPEHQIAVIERLKEDPPQTDVGLVYNLHHGHDHLERFPEMLKTMLPHLKALNLNGMVAGGDRTGRKILPLGQGDRDLDLLRVIRDSGWRGPVGILGHTDDDAEARLQDNLDGLDWLVPQLDGKPAGPRPRPRTPAPGGK